MPTRIIAFAGSTRRDSFNRKLLASAADAARRLGAEVTIVDLRELALPLYDGDLEAASGIPAAAKQLKKMMREHQGLLIASPEYNSSISGVLKNTIDWVSRPEPGETPLVAFDGKIAALLAASPGALGGLRGLVHLRSILGNIRVLVLPEQFALTKAGEAFDDAGALTDESAKKSVDAIARRLVEVAGRVHGS